MKRFFSLILTVAMLFSINTVAYASEVASGDEFVEATPIYVDVETRLMETFTSPAGALPATTTDIEASNNMEDKIVASANEDLTRAATWTYLSNYLVYNQTTSYNCGPASVQAALKYINGNTPTQAKIAEGCKTTTSGTYLSNMLTYINGQQSANKYVSKYNANSDTMKSCLYSGVVTYNRRLLLVWLFLLMMGGCILPAVILCQYMGQQVISPNLPWLILGLDILVLG